MNSVGPNAAASNMRIPAWIGVYRGCCVTIAVNRSRTGMRQAPIARVFSKMTRPNLPAGQFDAFDGSSRATITRYRELFGPGAIAAGMEVADASDSGTSCRRFSGFLG